MIDRRDGRYTVEIEVDTEGLALRLRCGELGELVPPPWTSLRLSDLPPFTTDDLLETLSGSRPVGLHSRLQSAASAPESLLLLSAVNAALSTALDSERADDDTQEPFVVPDAPVPQQVDSERRKFAEQSALWILEAAPASSWCAWWSAERCLMIRQPDWAAHLAGLGLRDLSSDSILADLELLFDLRSGAMPTAVADAWRTLYLRAASETAAPLRGVERRMLLAAFEALTAESTDDEWLQAGLARLWEFGPRSKLERRLSQLMGLGKDR